MNKERHAILFNNEQLGPYPEQKIKRVDQPTTVFYDQPKQARADETPAAKGARGDYGEAVKIGAAKSFEREPIFRALADINNHISNWQMNPISENKAELPDDPMVLTRHIKSLCYFLGADVCGICEVPKEALYTHDVAGNPLDKNYKYAIVVGVAKQRWTINASYGNEWVDDAVSLQAYQRLACQVYGLTSYIRRMGWPAEGSVVPKYSTMIPPLVLRAGLGEASRLCIMVNPFIGALGKYATVMTDLPLVPDKPIDFGLQEYCENCHMCSDNCPSGTIPSGDKVEQNGAITWRHVKNGEPCIRYTRTNIYGKVCQRCVKMCPWNHLANDPNQFKDWDGSIEQLHAMANKQAEKLKSNNYLCEEEKDRKWWLPLELNEKNNRFEDAIEFDYALHDKWHPTK